MKNNKWKKYLTLISLILIGMLFFTCNDKTGEQIIGSNPEIQSLILNYSQQNKSIFISAEVVDPQGKADIESVDYYLYYKVADTLETDSLIHSGKLFDNGENGDIIIDDNVYSILFNENIEEGVYRCITQAFDIDGNESELYSKIQNATTNSPPVIVMLEATDFFERGDTLNFKIRAYDPQGLDDIVMIKYDIIYPNDSVLTHSSFVMSDDGIHYGDEYANDGIFTVAQPYGKTGKNQGVFTFRFYAKDKADATSDTLKVSATNPGVTVIYPDLTDTLQCGEVMEIKWQSAFIDSLKLEYTINSNVINPVYYEITTVSTTDTTYNWTIPWMIDSEFCKIKIYDIEMPDRFDVSDNPFKLEP